MCLRVFPSTTANISIRGSGPSPVRCMQQHPHWCISRPSSFFFPYLQGASSSTAAAKPARPLALWESVVLGGSSAAIAGTIVFPMDTVKVILMRVGGEQRG